MKIGKPWFEVCAVLIWLFLGGCNKNTLNPQFEPEISNKSDSFQFQVTDLTNVSQTLQYTWQNNGTMANINQACSISSGSATLTINDAAGAKVYQQDLSENGSFITVAGTAGSWKIFINLSKVYGTLNFSAEKRTP